MKALSRLLLAGVAGTLVSGQALAQDPPAPYVSIFGGFGWPIQFLTNFVDNQPPFEGDRFQYITEFDNGALVGGAIGFNLMPGAIRAEIEVGRMAFNANAYYGITQGMTPPHVGEGVEGYVRTITAMANVWVTVNDGPVETYIGGGLGVGRLTTDICTDNLGCQFDGSTMVLAYQLGVGLIFPLSDRVSMDLGYRLRGTIAGRLNSDINGFDANAEALAVHVGLLGFTFGY